MPTLRVLPTDGLVGSELADCRSLMTQAFGDQFDDHDWSHALGGSHVLLLEDGAVLAHAAVIPRDLDVDGARHRTGYVEAVATAPERQGEGLGTLVMREVGRVVRETYVLGALATGKHAFYERLGWERWRGPTFVRTPEGLVRSEGEDDHVMVLRFGTTAGLDLEAPISCESRSGDDW